MSSLKHILHRVQDGVKVGHIKRNSLLSMCDGSAHLLSNCGRQLKDFLELIADVLEMLCRGSHEGNSLGSSRPCGKTGGSQEIEAMGKPVTDLSRCSRAREAGLVFGRGVDGLG